MSPRLFAREFLQSPRDVGAIWPSSPALANAMLAPIDFARARAIVEFGPGTGAFTGPLHARMRSGTRYVGIELNERFCAQLSRDFPALDFVHASVADLAIILASRDVTAVDAIVSGLPWASLPTALQDRVFPEIGRLLAPGGVFVTFAYLHGLPLPGARALRAILRRTFASVTRSPVVWANVPPAVCYICRK